MVRREGEFVGFFSAIVLNNVLLAAKVIGVREEIKKMDGGIF